MDRAIYFGYNNNDMVTKIKIIDKSGFIKHISALEHTIKRIMKKTHRLEIFSLYIYILKTDRIYKQLHNSTFKKIKT